MPDPTDDRDDRDDREEHRLAEADRMHDAVERYLDAEREMRGWRSDSWVIGRYGFAGLQRPLRPSATPAEQRAWMAERVRRERIDMLVIAALFLAFVAAVIVMSSGGDDLSDEPGWMNPQTLTQEVDPSDDSALPTSIPDGHGGTVTFNSGGH